jgi:hypothetical protein
MLDLAGNISTDFSSGELIISSGQDANIPFNYLHPETSYQAPSTSQDGYGYTGGSTYERAMFDGARSFYQSEWSWQNRPGFVLLPSILNRLSSIIGDLNLIGIRTNSFMMPYARTLYDGNVPGDSLANPSIDKFSYKFINSIYQISGIGNKIHFEDKVQELLKDFGVF